jgi:hypothetical protein
MSNEFQTPLRKRPTLGINVPPKDAKFRRASGGDFIPITPQSPCVRSPSSFPIRAAHEAGWDARHLDKYNVQYDATREYQLSDCIPLRFCDIKSLGIPFQSTADVRTESNAL